MLFPDSTSAFLYVLLLTTLQGLYAPISQSAPTALCGWSLHFQPLNFISSFNVFDVKLIERRVASLSQALQPNGLMCAVALQQTNRKETSLPLKPRPRCYGFERGGDELFNFQVEERLQNDSFILRKSLDLLLLAINYPDDSLSRAIKESYDQIEDIFNGLQNMSSAHPNTEVRPSFVSEDTNTEVRPSFLPEDEEEDWSRVAQLPEDEEETSDKPSQYDPNDWCFQKPSSYEDVYYILEEVYLSLELVASDLQCIMENSDESLRSSDSLCDCHQCN